MKYGARNQLIGKITSIKKDIVMSHVSLEIQLPAAMSSVMTVESLEGLNLKKGDLKKR